MDELMLLLTCCINWVDELKKSTSNNEPCFTFYTQSLFESNLLMLFYYNDNKATTTNKMSANSRHVSKLETLAIVLASITQPDKLSGRLSPSDYLTTERCLLPWLLMRKR